MTLKWTSRFTPSILVCVQSSSDECFPRFWSKIGCAQNREDWVLAGFFFDIHFKFQLPLSLFAGSAFYCSLLCRHRINTGKRESDELVLSKFKFQIYSAFLFFSKMRQCSVAEPHLPKRSTSLRSPYLFNSLSDLYLLIIVLASITFVVVLLIYFTFTLKFPVNAEPINNVSPVSSSYEKKDTSKKATNEMPQELTAHKYPRKPSLGLEEFKAKLDSSEQALPSFSVAVYTDHPTCSDIGRAILLQGGNSMDAAIASFFCLSAALPHRGGLGGGLMATMLRNSQCTTLNAREICPGKATEAYFTNRQDETIVVAVYDNESDGELDFIDKFQPLVSGPRAAAVPSSLNGLYRAFEKYASKKLSWRQLVNPTILLCTRGITVSEQLGADLQEAKSLVLNNSRMRSQFVNETTGRPLSTSEKMFCPLLADFLQELVEAENPLDYFYRGQASKKLVKSIRNENGFITMEDLEDCESEIQPALKIFVRGHTICGPIPPSTFSVVQLAVAAMAESNSTTMEIPYLAWDKSRFIGDPIFDETILKDARDLTGKDAVQQVLHRFRNHYGPEIQYESMEQGSFSIMIVDEKDDAVVMSSSLGNKFGNRELTEFGFFMNNAMGSFAYGTQQGTPQSRSAPLPAKCPITQMSPVIGIKDEQVAFITGGADYLEVTASLYQALTSRRTSSIEGAPLLCRRANGLILLNRNNSLLVGY